MLAASKILRSRTRRFAQDDDLAAPARAVCLLSLLLVSLALVVQPAAAQTGPVYCTLKEIRAEQLSNGVRVTIVADGQLQWDWDIDEMSRDGAIGWVDVPGGGRAGWLTGKLSRMPFVLRNARSGLGSAFIPIGKYPVSHAVIVIPDFAAQNNGIGLRVDVHNYLQIGLGEPTLFVPPGSYPWQGEAPSRYYWNFMSSDDQTSLILTYTSDRFPPPAPPTTPGDLPAELSVTGTADRITVKAVNARLPDTANAISTRTGLRIDTPPDSDLRVTCGLWNLPPDEVVEALGVGLGLCSARLSDGSWLLTSDVAAAGGYAAATGRRVQLHYLHARDAQDLLPNFLLKYLQVDEASNALTVVGPDWMTKRVEEDLSKLDVAPREVMLDVTVVEYASATSFSRALQLDRLTGNREFGFDTLLGDVSFLWLPAVGRGWSALLNSLQVSSTGKLRSTTSLRVLNGKQGKLFAGQQRTLVLQQLGSVFGGGRLTTNLQEVSIGTTLILQPQLGDSNEVLLHVRLEAGSLRATDPTTGLPEIGQRNAEATLRVKDGDTVLVAGLELSDVTKARRAIPVVGSLPLVGSLFRRPANSGSTTHLAVFMTPHIAKSGTVPQTAAAAPDAEGGHRSG